MFENLRIKNFRLFDDLEIGDLERINLLAGRNNTGKTTVLEAMYLLASVGNPKRVIEVKGIRGISEASGAPGRVPTSYWKPLFSQLNMQRPIEISGVHSDLGRLALAISLERRGPSETPEPHRFPTPQVAQGVADNAQGTSTLDFGELLADPWALHLSWETAQARNTSDLRVTEHGHQSVSTDLGIPLQAIYLPLGTGNAQEDAVRLGQLRTRKKGNLLTKALQVVEPTLESVEDNSATGTPMIWGDIGLPELTPLSAMGEGVARIARIVLATSIVPGGVVLVDEIENGFHHSIMNKVWAVVEEAALQFDAQVIATTHSYECVMAAHEALSDEWRLHRLDRTNDGSSLCVTYDTETVEAAIRHDLEVR